MQLSHQKLLVKAPLDSIGTWDWVLETGKEIFPKIGVYFDFWVDAI